MAGASRARACAAALLALAIAVLAGCGLGGGVTPIRTSFNRGVYLYNNGDYDGAINQFRRAVAGSPADHRARVNLALAYESKAAEAQRAGAPQAEIDRLRELARAQYEAALRVAPDSLRAGVNLAVMQWEAGEREQARERLRALAQRWSADALPLLSLGAILLREEQTEAALAALAQAAQRDPADPDVNALLGEAHRRLGQLDRARAALSRGVRTDPSDVGLLVALGRVEIAAQRWSEAIAALTRATYVDPDHALAHALLGEALEGAGRLEDAAAHLIRARGLIEPGDGARESLEERLNALYRRLLASPAGAPSADG